MTTKRTKRMWRFLALLFAFALVAAACGSDDDDASGDEGDDTQTTAAPTATTAAPEDGDEGEEESTDPGRPLSPETQAALDQLFADAADNRERIIDELTAGIEAGDYGVGDDNILRGPAGFEIDLNTCPADWSDTGGITDSEIRLSQLLAASGPLAAYGNISVGQATYYGWINENDPVTVDGSPLDVVLITRDDEYIAAKTIEFVDELIESENVFAITTGGSPNTLATYDTINGECIPNPYVITGHPAWGDPVNHPWTTGLQMAYSTEAILWGSWIKENLADQLPVKVGGLAIDNDFGLAYELGFEEWAHDNPDVVSEFIPIRHDPVAPTLTNEITTLAAASPDVFISMTAGNACLLAIQEVAASGLLEELDAAFTPSVCKAIAAYMEPAGEAADGWWIVGGGQKDTTDPKHIEEPFIRFINNNLVEAGLDPNISLLGTGYSFGYPNVETLKIAAALPGGLTRTNYMLALRSTDIYHPMLLDGIPFAANGAADGYFIEGSDFSQFDAAAQTWNITGPIFDANGDSPNCAWDKDNGGCR